MRHSALRDGRKGYIFSLLCSTAVLLVAPQPVPMAWAQEAAPLYYRVDGTRTADLEDAAKSWRDNPEFKTNWGVGAMNAEYAFARGLTGKDPATGAVVRLGVMDSGFDPTNPEFAPADRFHPVIVIDPKATTGPTATGVSGTYGPQNDSHGTKVTGTIGAAKNGTGMMGVAFDSELFIANTNATDGLLFGPSQTAFPASTASYLAAAYDTLAKQNIRFISNSWGSKPSNENYSTVSSLIAAYSGFVGKETWLDGPIRVSTGSKDQPAVLNNFSSGNQTAANASVRGSLPYFRPELEPNWLTTSGYSRTANATGVTYSQLYNKCGVAKYWCLVAPTGTTSTTLGTGLDSFTGTSAAQPHASAALALVMSRYDYLATPEARAVLLSTAQHMSALTTGSLVLTPTNDQVPDAITGWGLPDMKKAMNGPGQLLGYFSAAPYAGRADTWKNDVSDAAWAARRVEEQAEIANWAKDKAALQARLTGVPATDTAIQNEISIRQTRIDYLKTKTDADYVGVLDKWGDGSLTFSGKGTWSGNTYVRGGLLNVEGSLASKTIVDGSGIGKTATNFLTGATSAGKLGGELRVSGRVADVDVNAGGLMDVSSTGTTGAVAVTGGTVNLGGKSGRLTLASNAAATVAGSTGDATLNFSTLFVLDKGITGNIASSNSVLHIDAGGRTGDVTLTNGTGRLNGESGTLSIADGRIDGIGTLAGLVVHKNGVVAPGNPVGTMNVAGDARFEDGSELDIQIAAGALTSRIDVGNVATLGGVVRVVLDGADPSAVAATWRAFGDNDRTILKAASLANTFAGVRDDFAFLDFDLVYAPSSVVLALDKLAFATAAKNVNQVQTANAIDSLKPGDPLFDMMIATTTSPASEILSAASGDIHASLMGLVLDGGRFLSDATGSRLRQTLGGVLTTASISSTDGKDAKDLDGGFWTSAYGSWLRQDSDGNASGVEGSTGGVFFGADADFFDDWRVGALAGIGRSSVDLTAMEADIDSYTFGLYAARSFDQLKLSFGAAYSRHEIDTTRSVLGTQAKADYAANAFELYGEAGYTFETTLAAFEPFAGVAYSHLSTASFTETGAGVFSLSGKGETSDLAATTLGLRTTVDLPLDNIHGRVFGSAGWRHAFGDLTPETTLAFAGSADFTNKGLPIAKNALSIEAGFEMDLSSTASLGLSYAGQIAKDSSNHTVKANFNLKF